MVGNYVANYTPDPDGAGPYGPVYGTSTSGQSLVGTAVGSQLTAVANNPLTPWLTSVSDGDIVATGSARVGANYQVGSIVLGVEVDGSLMSQTTKEDRSINESANLDVEFGWDDGDADPTDFIDDSYDSVYTQNGEFSYEAELSNLLTARGRIGFAAGRSLVFLTGGLAAGEVRQTTRAHVTEVSENSSPDGTDEVVTNNVSWSGSDSEMKYGYAVGGGFSHAITDNVILTVDGYYYDLGKHSVTAVDNYGETSYTVSQKFDGYVARGGVEYKF